MLCSQCTFSLVYVINDDDALYGKQKTQLQQQKKRAHKKKTLSRLRFLLCAPAPAAPPHHIAFCLFIFISALMHPHYMLCVYEKQQQKSSLQEKLPTSRCARHVSRHNSFTTTCMNDDDALESVSCANVCLAPALQFSLWRILHRTKGAHQTTKTAATRQQQQKKILSSVCWMLCGGGDKSTSTRWALCLIHMLSARAFVCVLTENQDRTTRKIIVYVCC